MSSSSLTWSWDATPEFNDPALKSPIPCKHGYNCTYDECCAFVHPGEEGTERKIFPARVTMSDDGNQVWQPAVVRLVGYARGDAGFYERRRLRLSWAKWCERKGWTAPMTAPSHRRREIIDLSAPAVVAPVPAVVAPVAQVAFPTVPTPQLVQWFQNAIHNLHVQQMQAARNALGTAVMSIVTEMFTSAADEMRESGLVGPRITPYFIAGTLLERYTYADLYALTQNKDSMIPIIIALCEELKADKPVDARMSAPVSAVPPPVPTSH